MHRLLAATIGLVALFAASAEAQQSAVPQEVVNEVSADLADIQQTIARAYPAGLASVAPAIEITKRAPVYAGASDSSKIIGYVDLGAKLATLDKTGSYYAVEGADSGWNKGWVSASNAVPASRPVPYYPPTSQPIIDQVLDEALKKLIALKAKYDGNKYVRISGFSVTPFPPSATVNFEFK